MTMPNFSPKTVNNNEDIFRHGSSAGANNTELARILVALDSAFTLLGWKKGKELIDIITGYQASIDTQYHNDYKTIAAIQELDKRIHTRGGEKQNGKELL